MREGGDTDPRASMRIGSGRRSVKRLFGLDGIWVRTRIVLISFSEGLMSAS